MEQNLTLGPIAALATARSGARPATRRMLPHRQLDQLPPPALFEELVARSLEIPGVQSKQSRMATPGSCALYLADEMAAGPSEAFIDAHEFCHIHPPPESGIHLTLPPVLREEVERLGWGEPHPVSLSGIMTALMAIYLPRDRQELDVVLFLILQSCNFARGAFQAADIPVDTR